GAIRGDAVAKLRRIAVQPAAMDRVEAREQLEAVLPRMQHALGGERLRRLDLATDLVERRGEVACEGERERMVAGSRPVERLTHAGGAAVGSAERPQRPRSVDRARDARVVAAPERG